MESDGGVIQQSVTVTLTDVRNSCEVDHTASEKGEYQLKLLPPGSYTVRACGGKLYRFNPQSVEVGEGKAIDLPLHGTRLRNATIGTIKGNVSSVNGTSERQQVALKDIQTGCEVEHTATNDRGEYEFHNLPLYEVYEVAFPNLPHQPPVQQTAVLGGSNMPLPHRTGFGTLAGTITDPTGAVATNATIKITFLGTGTSSTTTTGTDGSYRFANLPIGLYQFTVQAQGYKTDVAIVTVTQNTVQNAALRVGSTTEIITVETTAPLLDTTTATVGETIDKRTVQDIPNNGRQFIDFAMLAPGVIVSETPTYNPSLADLPSTAANATLDGAKLQGTNGLMSPTTTGLLSSAGIQEYQITTSTPDADQDTTGPQVRIISKQGVNELHGSVFAYLQNDAVNARNFFDYLSALSLTQGQQRAPLRREQFGGTLGGHITQDKTFFFATYEGIQETLGNPYYLGIASVPPAACHTTTGIVDDIACFEKNPTSSGQTTLSSTSQALLALFPVPNLPNNQFTFLSERRTNQNFGQLRIDHRLADADQLFARYTISDSDQQTPEQFPQFKNQLSSHNQYLTVGEDHTFSTELVNMIRLSISRTEFQHTTISRIPSPSLSLVAGREFGTLNIGGFTPLGSNPLPSTQAQTILSGRDDVDWTRRRHGLKLGMLLHHNQLGVDTNLYPGGLVQFNDLASFAAGAPRFVFAQSPVSDTNRYFTFTMVGFYLQDEYRLNKHLTVKAGIRYDFHTTPREANGKEFAFRDLLHDNAAQTTQGPVFRNPSFRNVSPRVGLAWDILGDQRSVLQAGLGIYYDVDQLGIAILRNTLGTPPLSTNVLVFPTPLTLPVSFSDPSTRVGIQTVDFFSKQPTLFQYDLIGNQQLPWHIGMSAAYHGARGQHLFTTTEGNPVLPAFFDATGLPVWATSCVPTPSTSCRRNPNLNAVTLLTTSGDSWYNALRIGISRAFRQHFTFHNSYTWAKALDTVVGGGVVGSTGATALSNPFRSLSDKGPSDFDARQQWQLALMYEFPKLGTSNLARAFLHDWSTSSAVVVQSGYPFTPNLGFNNANSELGGPAPDRASIVTPANLAAAKGVDSNAVVFAPDTVITGNPTQWFNPHMFTTGAFGTLGTASRNLLRGPGFATWDLVVEKRWKFPSPGERGTIVLQAQSFNVLNRTNFALPNPTVLIGGSLQTQAVSPTAGQITSTTTPARQIQLALRVEF